MKKILLSALCISLMVILTVIPVAAYGVGDWTAGNGFLINDKNSKVVVEETEKGIQVTEGGYYVDGKNWSGVVSNEKYKLDGFTMEIYFDKVPVVTETDDCWISIGFPATEKRLFQVGDIPSNPGYSNLIRYGRGDYETYENVSSFAKVGSVIDDTFKLVSGDTLKVEVKKNGNNYEFYMNGIKSGVDLANYGDIYKDGTAYVTLAASLKDSAEDAYTYTIVSINGEPTTTPVIVEEAPAPEKTPAETTTPTAPVTTNTAPQTNDNIFIMFTLIVFSAVSMVIIKKRREN